MKLKVVGFEEAVRKVRRLAKEKLQRSKNADKFVEIGEADGFKLYATAGKTVNEAVSSSFHENSRDVFMLLFDGELEFMFEDGEKVSVKKGQCFVLPKRLRHRCVFKEMTVALEGVYEKGL
jgi:mannose-6-phosphate isomerase-like protein (cupin superfamily)